MTGNDQVIEDDLHLEMKRVERLAGVGRHAEAIALLNDLSSEHPGRFEPYFRRAMSRHALNDRVGAIADLTEAIAINPDEPASFFFAVDGESRMATTTPSVTRW